MFRMTSYRDLDVWKKSINLVVLIYKQTELFPKNELYGLTSQIRRAAVSIPSNIAEGYYRSHRKEYAQFIRIAFASGGELETQLTLAEKLDFISSENHKAIELLLSDVMKMLNKLIMSLTRE